VPSAPLAASSQARLRKSPIPLTKISAPESTNIASVGPSKTINATTPSAIPPRMNNQVRWASFTRGSRLSVLSSIDGRVAQTTPTGIATTMASRRRHHSPPHHSLRTKNQTATEASPKKNVRR
jgi:hypothetical protein